MPYALKAHTRTRLKITAIIIITALMLYFFYLWFRADLRILIDDWANRVQFLSTARNLVVAGSLVSFILLITLFWVKRLLVPREAQLLPTNESAAFRPSLGILVWFLGIFAALGIISGTSIYVDPRNMYGTTYYAPFVVPGREEKLSYYAALENTPDVVVMGSSRAFALSPAQITAETGYSAFNMSLASGRINDVWIYSQYMLTQHNNRLPRVIILEIDFPIPVDNDYTASYSPLSLFPFMDSETRRKALQYRLDGLLDVDQFAESLYSLRFTRAYGSFAGNYQVQPDGWTTTRDYTEQELAANLVRDIDMIPSSCWQSPRPEGERLLRDYITLAHTHGSTVLLLRMPYQPTYYSTMRERMPNFDTCENIQREFFASLASEYDNVLVADYHTPESFPGIDTVEGFYDRYHLTNLNASILIEQLLGTIRQGYQLALEQSALHPQPVTS